MKLARTTRWVIAGAALGLSVALSAGVAFAVGPGPAGPTTPQASLVTAQSGGAAGTGSMGEAATGGSAVGGSAGMMGSSGGSAGMMGSSGGSTGMMGSSGGSTGMMDGGGEGSGAITNGSLAALVTRGEQGASIDKKANTVTYGGHSLTLVALASPDSQPDMTWEIDGMINPTVVVQPGTQIDVMLANTDWGYMHGFELTTTPPPYPYMAMAGVADNFFLMPLPPRTQQNTATASYDTRSSSFTTTSGTYHYFCSVPGHAAAGMFGTLVVH